MTTQDESPKNEEEMRGGGLIIPVGFRFQPTDEELLLHYLKPKLCSLPLPPPAAAVIPQFGAFHTNPWDLPGGNFRERRYFFCRRVRNTKSSSSSSSGYWKAIIGQNKYIVVKGRAAGGGNMLALGLKKSLVFYQVIQRKQQHKGKKGLLRTGWVMHEYSLLHSSTASASSPNSSTTPLEPSREPMIMTGDWVVCVIHHHQKTKMMRKREENWVHAHHQSDSIPPLQHPQPSSSSSSSSTITEVSSPECDELNHHEASSF